MGHPFQYLTMTKVITTRETLRTTHPFKGSTWDGERALWRRPKAQNLTKRLRTNGDNTRRRLDQRHYDDLNSSLSQSGQTMSQDTQDIQTTTPASKNPDSEKRNGQPKSGIFFFRTPKGKRALVGALERFSCGTRLRAKRS